MTNLQTPQLRRALRTTVAGAALALIIPAAGASAQTTSTTIAMTAETTAPASDSIAADTAAVPDGGVSAGYGGTAGNNGGFAPAAFSVALLAVVSGGVFLGLRKKRNATN